MTVLVRDGTTHRNTCRPTAHNFPPAGGRCTVCRCLLIVGETGMGNVKRGVGIAALPVGYMVPVMTLGGAPQPEKLTCPNNHTGSWGMDGRGHRACRQCVLAAGAKYNKKRRAKCPS